MARKKGKEEKKGGSWRIRNDKEKKRKKKYTYGRRCTRNQTFVFSPTRSLTSTTAEKQVNTIESASPAPHPYVCTFLGERFLCTQGYNIEQVRLLMIIT